MEVVVVVIVKVLLLLLADIYMYAQMCAGGPACLKDNALDLSLKSKTVMFNGASLCLSKTAKVTPMLSWASASVTMTTTMYDYDYDYDYDHCGYAHDYFGAG